ncbi:hypothetical protein OE88DRAFT_1450200 [Heliocybe sulcata]|uniref:C2H2-type domain-containing protein n=1 Tax=Heliocybe sulcata TaxID=5364 RepID=A0A5C3NCR4_9AGAM|nr:hypothetical protein OE88DRAFT_1450200 [Heliocybe sulcata]
MLLDGTLHKARQGEWWHVFWSSHTKLVIMEAVHLTLPRFVDLAEKCFKEFPCKWERCNAILNSFETFIVHIDRHYEHATQIGDYECQFRDCVDDWSHTDPDNLQHHIRTLHLNLYDLPCPVTGCNIKIIARNQLTVHFLNAHGSGWTTVRRTWLPSKPSLPAVPLGNPPALPLRDPYITIIPPLRPPPTSTERSLDLMHDPNPTQAGADPVPFEDIPRTHIPKIEEDPLFELTDFYTVRRQDDRGGVLAGPPVVVPNGNLEDPSVTVEAKPGSVGTMLQTKSDRIDRSGR